MIITVNENIRIWKEFNPIELSLNDDPFSSSDSNRNLARLGFNKERIAIRGRWFDVLTLNELVRKRNTSDGYYRVIYIQINMENGEYYIGKANRPKWSELKRYQGSGLKFASKFKKNKDQFVRYYIASCETAEETEQLEASIVDKDLLADEQCLNLVAGGSGTSKHPSRAETSEKKREHMINNPEQYKPMLEASREAFCSGDTPKLRARNQSIKDTMSTEEYSEMSRVRMEKWKKENPNEYTEARKKNREAIKSPEVQEKRKASLDQWKSDNPDKHQVWEKKRLEACASEESKEKQKASIKNWRNNNPEKAKKDDTKRAKAAAAKTSKEVCMIDLQSGKVLKIFPSQQAAARWLVENGIAKNTNCVSSINGVCLRRPCKYGYRQKAYGYDWRFRSEIDTNE